MNYFGKKNLSFPAKVVFNKNLKSLEQHRFFKYHKFISPDYHGIENAAKNHFKK